MARCLKIGSREIVVNSDYMKIVVASHYRYTLGYKYVCTEYEFMDVCACNGRSLIEIECKISKADLKKEIKKPKHLYYSGQKKSKYAIIPNKYYIAITKKMSEDEEVLDFIEKLNPNYGIITMSNWRDMCFYKNAKTLKKEAVEEKIKEGIVARISSENLILRKKLYDINYAQKKDEEK